MCGRYSLSLKGVRIENELDEVGIELSELTPRYNIAPGQAAPVIRSEEGRRKIATLRWGLIPGWAKDPRIAFQCINARSETVATKPAFRSAFKRRRCVVPADGFYEWQRAGKIKLPWRFVRSAGTLMEFAGLWEHWSPPEGGDPLETFTICTTTPNAVTRAVHDRMPVILSPEGARAWIDPNTTPEDLTALMKPAPDDFLTSYRVSPLVNHARNEVPQCADAVSRTSPFPEGAASGLTLELDLPTTTRPSPPRE